MKKFLLLFLFVAFGVSSCSSDDTSDIASENLLIGSWDISKEMALDVNGNIVENNAVDYTAVCPRDKVTIFENHRLKITDYEYNLDLSGCALYEELEGTWSHANDFLSFSFSDSSTSEFEVMTLDADILVLEYPVPEDIAPNYELNVTRLRLVLERIK